MCRYGVQLGLGNTNSWTHFQIFERLEQLKSVDLDIGVKRKNIEFQKVNETIITTFIEGLGKFTVETYDAQPVKNMRERTAKGGFTTSFENRWYEL